MLQEARHRFNEEMQDIANRRYDLTHADQLNHFEDIQDIANRRYDLIHAAQLKYFEEIQDIMNRTQDLLKEDHKRRLFYEEKYKGVQEKVFKAIEELTGVQINYSSDTDYIETPDGEYCEVIEAPAIEYSDGRKIYLNGTYGD